jgi:HSP20 family protein
LWSGWDSLSVKAEGEPLRELEHVTERMRRMLDETFGGLEWPSLLTERVGWSPPVDIEETDDAYVIEAELPSVKREDVNIEPVGNGRSTRISSSFERSDRPSSTTS